MTSIPEDFYRPPDPVTFSLLKVGGQLLSGDAQEVPQPLLETAREDIALRLWGGLAGLARAHTVACGEESCELEIVEAARELTTSLRRRLGLERSERAHSILWQELLGGSEGFFHWLLFARRGEYPAAWGVMHYDGSTLSFTDVRIPRFLSGEYRRAESMRGGRGRHKETAYIK
jgi:hypothetical protein